MTDLFTWVTTHWAEILQAIVSVIGTASIIVKLTPTPKDDTILAKVVGFLGKWIALNPKPTLPPPA